MRSLALLALVLLVVPAAAPRPPAGAVEGVRTTVGARAAAGLPADRLHFGIANGPQDLAWMTGSGAPWRYRYQYLAGGVNTPGRWTTWQSPQDPPGQFVLDYVNQSHQAGYIPVLTYYELLQSTPSSGASESDRDFSNLNDGATMSAYYQDFRLLMQKAAQAGGTVVVHVEPDLWGYMEQRAGAGDATSVSAAVSSSGVAEAQGLPDTVAGFAHALLRLRDLYAPGVLLAVHASPWAAGADIASDTSPAVDAAALAGKTAAFLAPAGLAVDAASSRWDLVFNDLDDHDAGWWEAQGADNSYFTHWWDPANRVFPNFTRYLTWVGALRQDSGLPQVAWQVPEGNQYYLTMNNTCGHYQDNVAQYFLSHPGDLQSAGLVAVLFGSGNACQTTNTDAQGDGVGNNGGLPTSDAAGWCSACNSHTSVDADDDGGYLRHAVAAYYASTGGVQWVPWAGTQRGSLGTSGPPLSGAIARTGVRIMEGQDESQVEPQPLGPAPAPGEAGPGGAGARAGGAGWRGFLGGTGQLRL